MYSDEDLLEFVECVNRCETIDDKLYDIFVRNQHQLMTLMVDVSEDALIKFIENLKEMNFNFNGDFHHIPLAAIMLDRIKYQKFRIYEKLFDCGKTDLNKTQYRLPKISSKLYRKVITNSTIYGFDYEGCYDVLLLFLENDFTESLYKHNVNIAEFVLSQKFDPDARTINMIIKFDRKNRFRDSLLEKRNLNLKENLRCDFNNIYNLFFD